MRILMISLDRKILENNSAVQKRHFEYGKICDELHIVVLGNAGSHGMEHENTRKKIPLTPFAKGGIGGNVKIYTAGGKNKVSRFFKAAKLAGEIVKKNKIDLITTQDAAYTGLIGYCLKKKFKIKLNAQIHGMEEKFLNKILFLSLKKKIIKNADSIRVVSERMKDWVIKKYAISDKKIFIIPVFSEMAGKLRNLEIKKLGIGERVWRRGDFTILTVGRLVKVKNIKLQIKVMAEVIKIFPETKLVVTGDGSERNKLHKLAKKLKLKSHVEFAGWQENLKPYYENADLFLLTSDNEGWGMAVIEAMSAGCPVIMTDVGCAREVVRDNENGLVIPVRDKKALIAAICKIIADKKLRVKLAEKAFETVKNLPDEEKILEVFKKMWEK